ncbi:MAG: CRISPR-associated endonuclease Cas2 [Bacteroidales bacterium]|nr:CRISPR-associated endonuclease Cas2 [Bacteroidales bacterium]
MFLIISYDVETVTSTGKARLRHVAKTLENYAQRVQNSVFEANIDYGTYLKVKDKLLKIIDTDKDSLRIYHIGNNWKEKIEHFGTKEGYDTEGFLDF